MNIGQILPNHYYRSINSNKPRLVVEVRNDRVYWHSMNANGRGVRQISRIRDFAERMAADITAAYSEIVDPPEVDPEDEVDFFPEPASSVVSNKEQATAPVTQLGDNVQELHTLIRTLEKNNKNLYSRINTGNVTITELSEKLNNKNKNLDKAFKKITEISKKLKKYEIAEKAEQELHRQHVRNAKLQGYFKHISFGEEEISLESLLIRDDLI